MIADDELAQIVRCLDLQEHHVAEGTATRAACKRLLARLAGVSSPGTGAAKALLVYARLATTACDWIDGDLSIDLVEDRDATVVEACTELGGGLRERLFPPLRFDAPLAEFSRAIARVPRLIAPLAQRSTDTRRIRLAAMASVRRTTAPPPPFQIAEGSLFAVVPAPPPPVLEAEGEELLPLPIVRASARPARAKVPPPDAPRTEPPIEDVDEGWDE